MNQLMNDMRLAIIAAVILLAGIAYVLLRGGSGPAGPTPTPTPTAPAGGSANPFTTAASAPTATSRISTDVPPSPILDKPMPGPAADKLPSSWAMFHGQTGLTGVADGKLGSDFKLLWKFKTGDCVVSSPVVAGGVVYVGSDDGNLYAIDFAAGTKLWSFKVDSPIQAAPLVLGGAVYFGSLGHSSSGEEHGGSIYALDAKTGTGYWRYNAGGKIQGGVNFHHDPKSGKTYVLADSYENNTLHCVDSLTGKQAWRYQAAMYINGAPAIADGKALFGGCDAMIHVVSLADGTRAAGLDGGAYIASSAATDGKQVYLGNHEMLFLCADIASERTLWRFEDARGPYKSTAAVAGDKVVVGCEDRNLYCLDRKSGKLVWKFPAGGAVDGSPAICGDKVVVGSGDGTLYVLNLADGKQVWRYEAGEPFRSSPAVIDGKIIIGCDDGYVYCFGPK